MNGKKIEPSHEYFFNDNKRCGLRHFIKSESKNVIVWLSGRNDYFYHYHVINYLPNYNIIALDFYDYVLNNDFEEQYKILDIVYEKYIRDKYLNVTLYGFDLGGLIVLAYYLLKNPTWFNKLILNNPFINISSNVVNNFTLNYIYPLLLKFDSWKKYDINPYTNNMNFLTAKIKELGYIFDENIKFQIHIPITMEFIHDVHKLQNKIKQNNDKITIPVLILKSDYKDDRLLSDLDINDFCKEKKIQSVLIKNSLHDVLVSNTLAKNLAIDSIKKFLNKS
jgi:alpha-beta hydrolase superfamily lysophospholipase